MNRIYSLFIRLIKHELIAGSFFIFIGGVIGSFLSFIYNLFLARTLTYSDYGIYVSLLSLVTLAMIPSQSLTAVVVRFATHYFAKDEEEKGALLFKKMSLIWLFIGLVIFLFIFIFSTPIKEFLHINDSALIAIAGLSIAITYINIVNTAFLQSLLKFSYIAITLILGSLGKLILGAILVILGFKILGALFGIFLMSFIILSLGYLPLFYLFKKKTSKDITIDKKEIIIYSLPVVIAVFSLSSFISTDVILVKHFFDGESAGFYGGLSVVGKVIFYFTAPIPAVMFPLLVRRSARGENFNNLFYLALLLVAIPGILITFLYFIFPAFFVNLFLGGREYGNIIPYLGIFGIFLTVFSFLNVFVNFFLSIKKTNVAYLVALGAILQIILIYLFHQNFQIIILDSIASSSLLLGVLILYYIRHYFPRP